MSLTRKCCCGGSTTPPPANCNACIDGTTPGAIALTLGSLVPCFDSPSGARGSRLVDAGDKYDNDVFDIGDPSLFEGTFYAIRNSPCTFFGCYPNFTSIKVYRFEDGVLLHTFTNCDLWIQGDIGVDDAGVQIIASATVVTRCGDYAVAVGGGGKIITSDSTPIDCRSISAVFTAATNAALGMIPPFSCGDTIAGVYSDGTIRVAAVAAAPSGDAVQATCPSPPCPGDCTDCCKTLKFTYSDCRGQFITHTFVRGNGISPPGATCAYVKIAADSEGFTGGIGFDTIICQDGQWKMTVTVPCDDGAGGGHCQMVFTTGLDCAPECPPLGGSAWNVIDDGTNCEGDFVLTPGADEMDCDDDEEDI